MLSSLLSRDLRCYSVEVGCQSTLGQHTSCQISAGQKQASKSTGSGMGASAAPQGAGNLTRRGKRETWATNARSWLCSLLLPPGLIQLILSTQELIETPEFFQSTSSDQIKAVEPS